METKNIIITGASRGIGFALCLKYLESGHNVLAISRNLSSLKNVASSDSKLTLLETDISQNKLGELVQEKINDWKKVDVIFNNAGLLVKGNFNDLIENDFQKSWQVNFMGPVRLIQACLSKLKTGSHVVNISTMGAVQGSVKFAGLSAYSSSKAALTNLTELLAEEYSGQKIAFNSIALGAVQTEMLEEAFPGFQAPLDAREMADWLFDFGLNGHKYFNGKIIQASSSTP